MVPIKENGSYKIYHNTIKPFMLRQEKGIDATIKDIKEAASDTLGTGERNLLSKNLS